MRRVLPIAVLISVGVLAYVGWQKLQPPPPPPVVLDEKGFSEVERKEYEAWMQTLGYTE